MVYQAGRSLMVIGLDCAEPDLIFNKWREKLPSFNHIMKNGFYAQLESTVPAITVPAWVSMVTGKDPGELGIYGFRNRRFYDYGELYVPNSNDIKEKSIWEYLDLYNKRSFLLGIPMTYPVKRINGIMVSGFLAPGTDSEYTYPIGFRKDIYEMVGEYIIDVKNFRTNDKEWLLKQIISMTKKRFDLFIKTNKKFRFDFSMMVEMGVDRIHHGFWSFMAKDHPRYIQGSPYKKAILDYYKIIDRYIGQIITEFGDSTDIIIVSDHGAKTMKGGFNINQWLMDKGYLTLKTKDKPDFKNEDIDWERTRAWGSGGYYSRIFLNIEGREPAGIIRESNHKDFLLQLKEELEAVRSPNGDLLGNKGFLPGQIYKKTNNIPPDLILYPADLNYRSIGTVGHGSCFSSENDTGPDDANHAQNGILMYYGSDDNKKGNIGKWSIYDIAGTIVRHFKISSHSSKSSNIFMDKRSRNLFFD